MRGMTKFRVAPRPDDQQEHPETHEDVLGCHVGREAGEGGVRQWASPVRKLAAVFNSGGVIPGRRNRLSWTACRAGHRKIQEIRIAAGSGDSARVFREGKSGGGKGFCRCSPPLFSGGWCWRGSAPAPLNLNRGRNGNLPQTPRLPFSSSPAPSRTSGPRRPARYGACEALPLGQFWKGEDRFPGRRRVAYAGATERGLSFYVHLLDSDIFSRATGDEQKMPALGDVVESSSRPAANGPTTGKST